MYKCRNCRMIFEEPTRYCTTYESYFGVFDLFISHTPFELYVCPYCEHSDYFEIERSVKYEKKNNKLERNKLDISRHRKP